MLDLRCCLLFFEPGNRDCSPLNDDSSNAEIEAISLGDATITISKDGYYDAELYIRVIDQYASIEGEFYDRSIAVGSVTHIDCLTPGVSYDSSDTAIATVSSEGDITGIAVGATIITTSRSECESVSFTVTVVEPIPEIEGAHYLEFDAAEFVNSMARPEETPLAHGGESIGFFRNGAKAIIRFSSDKADAVTMHFMLAWRADMNLNGTISIAVNGIALNLAGKTLKGGTGEFSYYEFRGIQFDNVAIVAGQNTIELETFVDGLNLDCIAITDTDASIVQVPAPQAFEITAAHFDELDTETQTVRLYLLMNIEISSEWNLEHVFHIKLVIGENTYEGDVRFVANEYIPNN